jgi:PKD repeat protein
MYFGTIGNYTITHGASNYANSDIETKVDYIYVYNSTALITTEFAAMDATSGYNVNNVQIDLQDIENASWTNTTAPFGRAWISTLAGHTINAYASTLGYSDADLLAQPALGPPVWYSIQMFPTGGFTNVTDGLVTLYITVKDDLGNPIPGATIFGGGSGYGVLLNSSMFSITTNEAGIASIAVPNKTNIHMTASKTGYQTTSQVVYSGVGSGGEASVPVTIMLPRLMVTPTVTATTLPGGATPHPTIDPYTLLSPEEKQTSLANMVLDVGPALVGFFIVLTFIGGIKMIGKK